jgi:4-amino-4-deoxy-L-arabinose transferase-like glycosyltransferase
LASVVWPERLRGQAPSRWVIGLLIIAALGLVLRVVYVLGWHNPAVIPGDAFYYHHAANLLVDGKGFPDPYAWQKQHILVPNAQHPPLYIIALAIPSVVGLRSYLDHQLFTCLIGAGSIVLVGLAGRRLIGPRAGLFAAVLAALYPEFWMNDALVLSESLSIFLTAGTILAAYRFVERRSLGRAAVLGVLIGLAALTRAELVLLMLVVAVPLMLLPRAGFREQWRRRVAALAAAAAGCVLIIAPWTAYNLTRFDHPEFISSGLGPTLFVANCPSTWSGPKKGFWDYDCIIHAPLPPGDASSQDIAYRKQAVTFIKRHKGQLPGEVVARVGRVWGFYHPNQQLQYDTIETRELPLSRAGLLMFYVLAAAAIPGVIALARRRIPLSPLFGPIITVTVAAAVFYGTTRFRAAAEPSMVLLATAGFAFLWTKLRGGRKADGSAGGSAGGTGGGVDEPVAGSGDEVAALPGP